MAVPAKIPLVGEQSFGQPPQNYSQAWFSIFIGLLVRRLSLLSGPYDPQRQVLLQSPDDRVWKVTVDNAGALTTTLVDVTVDATRKERPPL